VGEGRRSRRVDHVGQPLRLTLDHVVWRAAIDAKRQKLAGLADRDVVVALAFERFEN
jgi:hypothetical protein